jgi:hypothetical protein
MSFSLPRFLRRVQPSDLQRYFSARAILFSEPIDWTAKSSALVDSVKTAIEVLPERDRAMKPHGGKAGAGIDLP